MRRSGAEMRTLTRLTAYGAGLVALFVVSFAVARGVVPEDAGDDWAADTESAHTDGGHGDSEAEGGHDSHAGEDADSASTVASGLSLEQDGYLLSPIDAPTTVDAAGTLSFSITGPDGEPLTAYDTSHDKLLHLIVVRTDGSGFRHVHPTFDGAGTWSIPWRWDRAGSYRLYADFVPTALGDKVALTRTVDVAGPMTIGPRPPEATTVPSDAYTVSVDGSVTAGEESELAFTVTRDGEPVTTLEPYLGAYGHLVALRDGDLAYLHVHPMGEPGDGVTEPGPEIEFMVEPPTAGRYWLYLDFQVDGTVHTAAFAITADGASGRIT
ncbi:MAG TPA: heavy-metal-associated domain-containing protein [Nocardioidaceae bacterium]|nr:heavy-metal-associated domain-containing protein [Nocardioidaceae bacterium]